MLEEIFLARGVGGVASPQFESQPATCSPACQPYREPLVSFRDHKKHAIGLFMITNIEDEAAN
jgi:hypothetical protein